MTFLLFPDLFPQLFNRSACHDQKLYAVDANATYLTTLPSFEAQMVSVFYGCIEPLMCSSSPCKYAIGLKTLVAAKKCAKAALAPAGIEYPVPLFSIVGDTVIYPPNAVA